VRYFYCLALSLLFLSCSKNKRATRLVDGTWKLEEILLNDGQQSYPNDIYVFAKGKSGGEEYASWTKYSADYTDTMKGSYLITKKGDQIILRNESVFPVQADTTTLDDIGKDILVIRAPIGVLYLYKQ